MQFRDKLLDRLDQLTAQEQIYNILVDDYNVYGFQEYLRREDVRESLHVGEITFTARNLTAQRKLLPDFLVKSQSKVEELLEHYRVLIYWLVCNTRHIRVYSAVASSRGSRSVFCAYALEMPLSCSRELQCAISPQRAAGPGGAVRTERRRSPRLALARAPGLPGGAADALGPRRRAGRVRVRSHVYSNVHGVKETHTNYTLRKCPQMGS